MPNDNYVLFTLRVEGDANREPWVSDKCFIAVACRQNTERCTQGEKSLEGGHKSTPTNQEGSWHCLQYEVNTKLALDYGNEGCQMAMIYIVHTES